MVVVALLWFSLTATKAVLFYSTGDPAYNTTAPGGALTNSGWQYEGYWNDFLGTAINPHYFITAKHVGGTIGDQFFLNGQGFTSTAAFDHPQVDLRIWRVRESLPVFAELYPRPDEISRPVVVFGRGTRRGDPVLVDNVAVPQLRGWQWGLPDGVKRWGENQVQTNIQDTVNGTDWLKMDFNANAGTNEADLSGGDSGGGLFIQDGAAWKLAGIDVAVDGPYNTTSTGAGFEAAIFDSRGLYVDNNGQWLLQPRVPVPQPGSFYAIRISTYLDWIRQIFVLPIPATLLSADQITGPFSPEPTAVGDTNGLSFHVLLPTGTRFFEIQDSAQRRILSITNSGGELIILYE